MQPRPKINAENVRPGDVIRAYRAGCKTKGNYVVVKVRDQNPAIVDDWLSISGHREHGQGADRYMLLRREGAYIIRSYSI